MAQSKVPYLSGAAALAFGGYLFSSKFSSGPKVPVDTPKQVNKAPVPKLEEKPATPKAVSPPVPFERGTEVLYFVDGQQTELPKPNPWELEVRGNKERYMSASKRGETLPVKVMKSDPNNPMCSWLKADVPKHPNAKPKKEAAPAPKKWQQPKKDKKKEEQGYTIPASVQKALELQAQESETGQLFVDGVMQEQKVHSWELEILEAKLQILENAKNMPPTPTDPSVLCYGC